MTFLRHKEWTTLWKGLSFSFLFTFSHADSVWVSTIIPTPLSPFGGVDLTFNNRGDIWATFYHYTRFDTNFYIAKTSDEQWEIEAVYPFGTDMKFFGPQSDRRISFDRDGIPHVALMEDGTISVAAKPNSTWQLDSLFTPAPETNDIVNVSLSIDPSNTPHLAALSWTDNAINLVYAKKGVSGWGMETAFVSTVTHTDVSKTHVSFDTDISGNPFMAYQGTDDEPLRILTKKETGWVTLSTFTNAGLLSSLRPSLRVDRNGFIHLIASASSGGLSARYVLMNSSGVVLQDITTSLPELHYAPSNTSLDLDSENRPHLLVGSAYIAPSGQVTYLPGNFTPIKLALSKGGQPFIIGPNGGASGILQLVSLLTEPGPPQLVNRSTQSMTWTFVPSTGAVLGHRLLNALDGSDVSGLLGPAETTFTQTGLNPNEPLRLITRAVFPGMVLDSPPGSMTNTLPIVPTDPRISRPSSTALSATWTASENVPGTRYRLRLIPPVGTSLVRETTDHAIQWNLLNPSIPYALSLSVLGQDGQEFFVSTLTVVAHSNGGTRFSYELSNNLTVDVSVQGSGSEPNLAFMVGPAHTFPIAPLSFGQFTPANVGFDIPTNQAVPAGESVLLTLHYPEGRLHPTDTLTLVRFDSDRNQWIPLSSQSDGANRRITATTRALGLFQVMVRTSIPTTMGDARVYPNPFHPALHNAMSIQEVPTGTHVRILSAGGQLVREFTAGEGNPSWDGRDGEGNPAHSGVYVLRLEQNGETKSVRFVLERP